MVAVVVVVAELGLVPWLLLGVRAKERKWMWRRTKWRKGRKGSRAGRIMVVGAAAVLLPVMAPRPVVVPVQVPLRVCCLPLTTGVGPTAYALAQHVVAT